jgi:hypothetical protein
VKCLCNGRQIKLHRQIKTHGQAHRKSYEKRGNVSSQNENAPTDLIEWSIVPATKPNNIQKINYEKPNIDSGKPCHCCVAGGRLQ